MEHAIFLCLYFWIITEKDELSQGQQKSWECQSWFEPQPFLIVLPEATVRLWSLFSEGRIASLQSRTDTPGGAHSVECHLSQMR